MIAYNDTFYNFKSHVNNNEVVSIVLEKLGQKLSDSEKRSIKRASQEMRSVLSIAKIPDDIRIGLEYKIPITSRRIDFIISGSDGNQDHLIIVELKQWDRVYKTEYPSVVQVGNREYVHPSWQAYSYRSTIEYFNEAVTVNNINLESVAFLHDYKIDYYEDLTDEIYKEAIGFAPVFIENDYEKLGNFIGQYIKYGSKKDILYEIEQGKIRPSKMLIDALSKMLNGNEEFVLLDEQKMIADYIYYKAIKQTRENKIKNKKKVFIVEGGAGTGKSLIAIDLLSKFITKKALNAFYVAKSSYVKENYIKQLTRNVPRFKMLRNLFKGSGSFIDSKLNEIDCLIVDEAHRLTERTKIAWFYKGENQVKEIINAAKVSVFFIDSKQQIDIKDFGSKEEIRKWADYYGADIYEGEKFILNNQFRCNGSDEYIAWVESILYNERNNEAYKDIDYDIKVFDNIMEMKKAVVSKNINNKARIISGDVFPWISMKDKSQIDININNFHAQWNRTKTFATDKNAIDEVGCIHTTQGMEFEYIGLIIGNDLLYRNNKVVTDFSRHPEGAGEFKRPHQRKINPSDKDIIDQLIRNTYRVLFTRGQKGCYIYCMDNQLSEYIKCRIKEIRSED
jgi:hypothetical protein